MKPCKSSKCTAVDSCCSQCEYFTNGFILVLLKYKESLVMRLYQRNGHICDMVTDLQKIGDVVKKEDMPKWKSMTDMKKFEMLKSHVVDVAEIVEDGDCPYRTEILLCKWNEKKG